MNPTPPVRPELAHDVLHPARRQPLAAMFAPRNIAVLGASESAGSVGQALMQGDTSRAAEIALQLASIFTHRFKITTIIKDLLYAHFVSQLTFTKS